MKTHSQQKNGIITKNGSNSILSTGASSAQQPEIFMKKKEAWKEEISNASAAA